MCVGGGVGGGGDGSDLQALTAMKSLKVRINQYHSSILVESTRADQPWMHKHVPPFRSTLQENYGYFTAKHVVPASQSAGISNHQ